MLNKFNSQIEKVKAATIAPGPSTTAAASSNQADSSNPDEDNEVTKPGTQKDNAEIEEEEEDEGGLC